LGARTQFTRFVISTSRLVGKSSNIKSSPPHRSSQHAHKIHPDHTQSLANHHASPSPHRGSAEEYARRRRPQSTCSTNTLTDCADVVAALDECHARGFLWKVTGNCTEAKYKVNMCLRAQRLEKTRQNREVAKEKRKKIEEVWAELDANK
jgi:COX assembly protein 2